MSAEPQVRRRPDGSVYITDPWVIEQRAKASDQRKRGHDTAREMRRRYDPILRWWGRK